MKGAFLGDITIYNTFAKGGDYVGQSHQFEPGHKAPNNGIYVEIGETGDNVKNPKSVKLRAGDTFPETSNHNRKWTYKSKKGH